MDMQLQECISEALRNCSSLHFAEDSSRNPAQELLSVVASSSSASTPFSPIKISMRDSMVVDTLGMGTLLLPECGCHFIISYHLIPALFQYLIPVRQTTPHLPSCFLPNHLLPETSASANHQLKKNG